MSEKKFSNKEAIKFGWEKMKENLNFFLIIGVIVLVVSIFPSIANDLIKKSDSNSTKIILGTLNFFCQVMGMLIGLGLIKISLKLIERKEVNVLDLFSQYPLFFKYLAGLVLYFIVTIGGMILFIVPGIIWGIKFKYFPYFIVEGYDVIESFKKSSQITEGSKWDLFVFGLVLVLIGIAGFLAFFIGTLITMPIVSMATVFVYKKLKKEAKLLENLVE